jgi:patatin-like phospholipase/acyl hydrolase
VTEPSDRFRILSVDGGGMRGLIPALVIADLERRLQEGAGPNARVADYFHMFAGTSTGGLVALSLTVPDLPDKPDRPLITAKTLADLYTGDGPNIFHRTLWRKLRTLWGWIAPKYGSAPLEKAVEHRLGDKAKLADALRELVVVAYDMTASEPYFFKRWPAREELEKEGPKGTKEKEPTKNHPLVDAALATSAAPTYFPSRKVDEHALVDGGVFAANPTIAAVVEALKRRSDEPHHLSTDDLLVLSIGTGLHETHFNQGQVSGWGRLGWVFPHDGEPPILATVLGGASDGVDHWTETLLNEPPPPHVTREEIGRGPRFYRMQVDLNPAIQMDDYRDPALRALKAAGDELIAERETELAQIADRLLRAGPLPPDTPPPKLQG